MSTVNDRFYDTTMSGKMWHIYSNGMSLSAEFRYPEKRCLLTAEHGTPLNRLYMVHSEGLSL